MSYNPVSVVGFLSLILLQRSSRQNLCPVDSADVSERWDFFVGQIPEVIPRGFHASVVLTTFIDGAIAKT